MKKTLIMAAGLTLAIALAGCGNANVKTSDKPSGESSGENVELTVFAAASMTETLTELAGKYKEVAPEVSITFTFDSSGTLKTQIMEGADCDLFISAAQKQMNELEEAGGYILEDTRENLLENKVVLVVAEDSKITSFADLTGDDLQMLCIGNEDVPVGAYSLKILDYLGIIAKELEEAGKITYGSNVKEVTTQVVEGVVDCGIIYATDAYSAGLEPVDAATEEMCGQVIYPAAVMSTSKNSDAAKDFLSYLHSDEASAVFESVGFTPIGEN